MTDDEFEKKQEKARKAQQQSAMNEEVAKGVGQSVAQEPQQ